VTRKSFEREVVNDYIARYKFDGNTNDETGNFNATNYGATLTTGVKGVVDTAYYFDGNDYIGRTSTNLGFNGKAEISISLWINTSQTSGRIIQKAVSDGWNTFAVMLSSGKIYCTPQSIELNQYPEWITSSTVSTGEWKHIMFTFKKNAINSTDGKIYVDNVEQTCAYTANRYSSNFTMYETSNSLLFGVRPYSMSDYLNGKLDNVRIYDRMITASEVTEIYNAEKP
jgi:hypothetical protein